MGSTPVLRTAALLLAVCCTAGCGSSQNTPVEDAARAFYDSVAGHDGEKACALLAPETRSELEQSAGRPCAAALLDEKLPTVARPVDVRVFGTMAEVRYADEVAFLTRFGHRWTLMAVGCRPDGDRPYDCQVKGS
ncbi:MAG: hypothetical protein JWN22_1143 [Nocardioides sp.]|jgi:hypothetical protein|nr:hypothetical protein [Nocardioides sp.]